MASTHQWPQPTCDTPNASIHHQNFQPTINKQFGTCSFIERNLEQKPRANNKQTTKFLLATYLHHIIDTKIGVAHHDTNRYGSRYCIRQ
jgi:hypothetical protein